MANLKATEIDDREVIEVHPTAGRPFTISRYTKGAEDRLVYIGQEGERKVILSRDDVAAMLPALEHFVDTGRLPIAG